MPRQRVLRRQVSVTDGVHRVCEGRVKSQQRGGERRINAQRGAGESAGTNGDTFSPSSRASSSLVDVAQQGEGVSVKMIGQQHWLRALRWV